MSLPWLEELNPAQREAVMYGDGALLVVAGAGTGKTKTLACRVAFLVEEKGIAPDRILLLTFTRRAAAQMVGRATRMCNQTLTGKIWGGTFHAVANRLLRIYGRGMGLAPGFTVMDEGDAADLMGLIRGELGLAGKDRRFPRRATLVKIYSRVVNAREKLDAVLIRDYPWCVEDIDDIRKIFDRYTDRKRKQQLMDYDDLLVHWNALCAAPGIGTKVADRFEHVLVDEYQDTNLVQAEILRGMRKNIKNVMVVGDDAQAIYSFRAATVRNIFDFPKQFSKAHIVKLEQNYRSTEPILHASNAVMSHAKERYTKELWSRRPSLQKPVLMRLQDESQQAETVCRLILERFEQGTLLREQAVLFRAGHHSDLLEVELSKRNIPFHKYGGLRFLEAAHIKDMLAILRILENPYDEISWFRVLQLMSGIGPKTAGKIMNQLSVHQQTEPGDQHISPLKHLLDRPPIVPEAAREEFAALRDALAACCHEQNNKKALSVQLARIRRFYEPIFEKRYENPKVRLRDIEQLEHISERYKSRSRFINDLTLDPPSATSDLAQPPHRDEDYLILSTIHSAKGLEWDVVHILHAADGMIPSDMAVEDEQGIDEERRLFYVAMTRAKNMLYVHFPLRYYHRRYGLSDAHNYAQLTRFISEPVRRCFEEHISAELEDDAIDGIDLLDDVDAEIRELWE